MSYHKSAFINCPFDKKYKPFLEKLVFILIWYGYEIKMSKQETTSLDRLNKIIELIDQCKYSFHDLSRNKFSRFNMPFELGLDFGCARYKKNRSDKVIAVLDNKPHEYDEYFSDLSGRDPMFHQNDSDKLFTLIPQWFNSVKEEIHGGPELLRLEYVDWQNNKENILQDRGYPLDIDSVTYILVLKEWVAQKKR